MPCAVKKKHKPVFTFGQTLYYASIKINRSHTGQFQRYSFLAYFARFTMIRMTTETTRQSYPLTPAQEWLGESFSNLHPLLQHIHIHGGTLQGEIDIKLGKGLAGFLGRRLAKKLGVPTTHARSGYKVSISHAPGKLIWAREFIAPDGKVEKLVTVFVPHGQYPHAYWQESTGLMHFRLTVDILEGGGWSWRVLAAHLYGIPLPVKLFPQSQAYKCIEDGRYRFYVGFIMPGLGLLLSYSGLLELAPAMASASPADSLPP